MKPAKLIQLGWRQFAAVFAVLIALFTIVSLTGAYDWQELYYRDFVVPGLQTRYGFRLARLKVARAGTTYYEGTGIVSVEPAGKFAQIGLRPGDAPFEYHGNAFTSMHYALDTAARGAFAAFDVVNAYDLAAGVDALRTIHVFPRVREAPVSLARHRQLRSPAGPLTIVAFESELDDTHRELWTWDPVAGSRSKLYGFRESVRATWSGDSTWLALTDKAAGRPSRCVVIRVSDAQQQDLTDRLMELPPSMRPASSDRLDCEVFGWVLDRPTRLAVVFTDLGANPGEKWIYDFYFDTPTGALVAAQSR